MLNKSPKDATAESFEPLAFNNEQLQQMEKYRRERKVLSVPTVLIVEDQEFSRKLLEGMLRRYFDCHSAADAHEAIKLYGEHMPCVTFLDIELPDGSGHEIAALIKKHDPESFIVMVTANNYQKDVATARENKVDGFVVKPFSKNKIFEAMEKYQRTRQHKETP